MVCSTRVDYSRGLRFRSSRKRFSASQGIHVPHIEVTHCSICQGATVFLAPNGTTQTQMFTLETTRGVLRGVMPAIPRQNQANLRHPSTSRSIYQQSGSTANRGLPRRDISDLTLPYLQHRVPDIVVPGHAVVQGDVSRISAHVTVRARITLAAHEVLGEGFERDRICAGVAKGVRPVGVPTLS